MKIIDWFISFQLNRMVFFIFTQPNCCEIINRAYFLFLKVQHSHWQANQYFRSENTIDIFCVWSIFTFRLSLLFFVSNLMLHLDNFFFILFVFWNCNMHTIISFHLLFWTFRADLLSAYYANAFNNNNIECE